MTVETAGMVARLDVAGAAGYRLDGKDRFRRLDVGVGDEG
jgi:hypothetical protein